MKNIALQPIVFPRQTLSHLFLNNPRIEEAGKALKKMKNGKSPGLDGYIAEFFQNFLERFRYIPGTSY